MIIGSVIVKIGVDYGLGRPPDSVSHHNGFQALMYVCIAFAFGVISSAMVRISFMLCLIRIFTAPKSNGIILWALIALQAATNPITIFLMFLQCGSDVAPVFDNSSPEDRCMSLSIQTDYGFFLGGSSFPSVPFLALIIICLRAFNSATDLFLAVFATYLSWNLRSKPHTQNHLNGPV